MSLDIYFSDDIADRLDSLDRANADALALALGAGADRRELRIARFAYKSALDAVALAFGLSPTRKWALWARVALPFLEEVRVPHQGAGATAK